jgi:hypothetical protein
MSYVTNASFPMLLNLSNETVCAHECCVCNGDPTMGPARSAGSGYTRLFSMGRRSCGWSWPSLISYVSMTLGTQTTPIRTCTCSERISALFLFTELTVHTQEPAVQLYLVAARVPVFSLVISKRERRTRSHVPVFHRSGANRAGESTTWKFITSPVLTGRSYDQERCDQAVVHAQSFAMDRN